MFPYTLAASRSSFLMLAVSMAVTAAMVATTGSSDPSSP
jgi:ABC-type proline/glycine betaine transport system permease subunit